ncbi:MAG TPA: thiamine phosphate synthase [Thermomicrobiales bacterium]|jgi:thiamine-phosphate diphosphorylase
MRPELKLGLYLVTDERLSRGRATAEIVRAAIRGGIDVVQLRGKDLPAREQLAIGRELRAITREAGLLFIVNDRVDLALALDADGVHVGQDDLPAEVVRQLVGPEMIVGVSAATIPEARAARDAGADYLGVGAIYSTATKLDAGAATGPGLLGTIAGAVALPLVAIGGINATNVAEVIAAGATGAAVVSAIVAADDPEAAARDLQRRIAAVRR